jgi:hypothetical protein
VEEEEGTLAEDEEEPRTPSQSTSKGEDEENMDKKGCGSNNHVIVKLQHQEECGSPSYVHYHMRTSK